jgi:hypothetical protein
LIKIFVSERFFIPHSILTLDWLFLTVCNPRPFGTSAGDGPPAAREVQPLAGESGQTLDEGESLHEKQTA